MYTFQTKRILTVATAEGNYRQLQNTLSLLRKLNLYPITVKLNSKKAVLIQAAQEILETITKAAEGRKTLHWAGVAVPDTNIETVALLEKMGWVWVSEVGVWDKAEYRPEFHQFSEF